ncbi:ATP-binding protein [Actinomadura craniellae]|nr:ATP-binding protein [Actinomadura craniellae]
MPSDFRPGKGCPDKKTESRKLVALPAAAREARLLVRDSLPQWGLTAFADDCAVAVSEFVTNSVRHAQPLAFIGVALRLTETHLVAEVHDASFAQPKPRKATEDDEGGRGLPLIEALTDQWGHYQTDDGKVCWAAWKLDGQLSDEP